MAKQLQVPFTTKLPYPVYFRTASLTEEASYPRHRHPWGEFVYAFSGVMELKLAHSHYLAPPQYGIWLPPGVEHLGMNRYILSRSTARWTIPSGLPFSSARV